jgi:predicted transposase/invertase (TIGR01784 family)
VAKQFLSHEQFNSLLYYVSQEGESKNFEQFYLSLAEALPNYREDIMTLAQQLEQKGLQQGHEKARHEMAKNLLAEGFSLDLVKKVTRLPDLALSELDKS